MKGIVGQVQVGQRAGAPVAAGEGALIGDLVAVGQRLAVGVAGDVERGDAEWVDGVPDRQLRGCE